MNEAREGIDNIARAIEDGTLTIFVGAGMSAAVGLPTAAELFKLLQARDPQHRHLHEDVDSLAVAADWCDSMPSADRESEGKTERDWLSAELLDILAVEQRRVLKTRGESRAHKAIVELGAVDIVTTNWDTMLEEHGATEKRFLTDSPPSDPPSGARVLRIHHGEDDSLITSTSDLLAYETNYEKWAEFLREQLRSRLVLFIGHGLADDWLRRFIAEDPQGTNAYAVDPFPNKVKRATWRHLGVTYLVGQDDKLLDSDGFFDLLMPRVGGTFASAPQELELRDFDALADALGTDPRAGHVLSELNSDRLYERPVVSQIINCIGLGRWNLIEGGAASGKSTVAMLVARRVRKRGVVVKYLNAEELRDVDRAVHEAKRLARRDLLILDDIHRNTEASAELLQRLRVDDPEDGAVCNVLLSTRPSYSESASIRVALKSVQDSLPDRWTPKVEVNAADNVSDLIKHRLRARKITVDPERGHVEDFKNLFIGDLAALCAALDAWDGEQPIRRTLAYRSVTDRLRVLDEEPLPGGPRALLILSAFWQYELLVRADALTSVWQIPETTIDTLKSRGEIAARPTIDGGEALVPTFHANTALLHLRATSDLGSAGGIPETWMHSGWNDSGNLGFEILREAMEENALEIAKTHDHFVYQGFQHVYVDLVESSLDIFDGRPKDQAMLLMNVASAYRRLSSSDFDRADRCLERARSILEANAPTNEEIDIMWGRLLYEEGYMLYLRNSFDAAIDKMHESFEKEFRPVAHGRGSFGMMSRLQEGATFYRKGEAETSKKIIHECLDWFEGRESPFEWKTRYSCHMWMSCVLANETESLDLDLAREHIRKAVRAREKAGIRTESPAGHGTLGIIQFQDDDSVRAAAHFRSAISEARKSTPEGEAQWHYHLGRSLEKTLEISNAKNAYRSAQKCDRLVDNQTWIDLARTRLEDLSTI